MISAAMSASMNSIAWNSTIGRAELPPLLREREREVQRAGGRAHRARADHHALLHEPVLRELVALADRRPASASSPTRTPSNAKIGCSNTNVCMYFGRAHEPHAGRVLVHQEDGGLRGVAVDVHVQLEEVGDVAAT